MANEIKEENLIKEKLPRHVAIIMDGNGRWAKKRGLSRIIGHEQGIRSVKEIVKTCREVGIRILTLYAFSLENWQRPADEVGALINFLGRSLKIELKNILKNDIRLSAIGNLKSLPENIFKILMDAINKTKKNEKMVLNLALSYGGRDEILQAIRRIVSDVSQKKIAPEEINEEIFSKYLFTAGLPDPDLLIRTSGELRLSNFLLWQMAYTEIYFTETLWPDFRKKNLIKALIDFQNRERRFGLTSEQVKGLG